MTNHEKSNIIFFYCNGVNVAIALARGYSRYSLSRDSQITSPREGVARYCFNVIFDWVCTVCVCIKVPIRPIFRYFISRLLEEISI